MRFALFLTLSVGLLGLAPGEEWREWRSTAGTTIKARLLEASDSSVVLERTDGIHVTVKRSQLSPESLAWLESAPAKSPATSPEANADDAADSPSTQLPALTEGSWSGQHAVADREHFTAVIQRNGQLAVHLKHGGRVIPGLSPILIRPECHVTGDTGWYRRRATALSTEESPTTDTSAVSFRAETTDGVTYQQHYAIEADRIQAWGACQDPEKLTPPTQFRVRVQVLRTHLLDDNAAPALVTERVNGSTWVADTPTGKVALPFDMPQSLTRLPNMRAVERLRVASSDWHGLSMDLSAPRPKHGDLQVWNYSEQALYQGFSASLHKSDSTESSKASAITLRIQPSR